jgi:PPIC-type PPIASE domain
MTPKQFTWFLLATLAVAQAPGQSPQKKAPETATQAKPAAPPTLQRPGEKPAQVEAPPDQPVITIRGLCPADTGPATKGAVPTTGQCAMLVTRQQFDNLIDAFNTNHQPVTEASRRKLAESYVEILIFAEAAKSAGVENTPAFAEMMRVLRLRQLAEAYRNQMTDQYRNPPLSEMEAYYQAHAAKYEGAKLSRIFLPKNSPDPQATPEKKQEFQQKVQQLLDEMQSRAAKGEVIDVLQKEAYVKLGISVVPPSTDMNTARRGMFPPKLDQEIFSHKAGEVFRFEDGNGYLVYRVDNREPIPFDSVKEEISRDIYLQKMADRTKELKAPVQATYDEKYFGPPQPAAPARTAIPNPSR